VSSDVKLDHRAVLEENPDYSVARIEGNSLGKSPNKNM
jgi:hypothetical protein